MAQLWKGGNSPMPARPIGKCRIFEQQSARETWRRLVLDLTHAASPVDDACVFNPG
jgi:hypothetical protein